MAERDLDTAKSVSESELELLKVLWDAGPQKVSAVREHLIAMGRSWAYNTVQTLLNRLETKKFVRSKKRGRALEYYPLVNRASFIRHHMADLAEKVCEGSQAPLVMALVKQQTFSKEEIRQFRSLLDELENTP